MTTTPEATYMGTGGLGHTNPYYTYSQIFSPKRLKELFKMCEFLFYNSPHIFATLRKFGEYPITELTYDTDNKGLKEKHKNLLEKIVRAKEFLLKATLDKYIYGNSFTSMYQPFVRNLICPRCHKPSNIKHVDYSFNVQTFTFSYKCLSCDQSVVAGEKNVEDRKLMLVKDINFIRWDPKCMDIEHNLFTGESVYYYTIPADTAAQVRRGDKHIINSTPLGFLKAVKEHRPFKFAPEAIFHMKFSAPAGVNPQWGLPPLLPALDRFFYTQVLRKANEAIALEHLVPFRIVSPAAGSGNGDPIQSINLSRWVEKMRENVQAWRKDPLHIMYAPIPIQVSQLNGQGRALLTLGEVQEAEKSLVAALGIPLEFLYGGLTGQGMEATLRMIDNQLAVHTSDLTDLLQWVDDSCSKFLGWDSIPMGLIPSRMVDDSERRNAVMQLWQVGVQTGSPTVSTTTIAELNDIDLDKESGRIKEESLQRTRRDQEIQQESAKITNTMAQQVQREVGANGAQSYDQQQVIANADNLVQQYLQMDPSTRRSQLHQLQMEDYVLYSVVIQRLEQQETVTRQQATVQSGG
jgi:hypothetical protein